MIQHDPKDPRIASILKIPHSAGNIIGCIERHFLSGCNNEYFFRIALSDRCRKTAAYHIPKNIVKHYIRLPGLKKLQILQKLKGCDDTSACTAKSRRGAAGLNAEDSTKALL